MKKRLIISPDLQQTLRNAGWEISLTLSRQWFGLRSGVHVYEDGRIIVTQSGNVVELGQYTPEKAVEIALLLRP